jgi:hypothetical protein
MKIVLFLLIAISNLFSLNYECTILDIRNEKTHNYKNLYHDNIKIFFNHFYDKIEMQTLTDKQDALFLYKNKNKNNIVYSEYYNKDEDLYIYIYNDFKHGVRIYFENQIIDTANCKKI